MAPHEFMEAVSLASNMRFKRDDRPLTDKTQKALDGGFGGQADPIQFLAWLFNNLKSHSKVINDNFKGQIRVKTTTHRIGHPQKITTSEQKLPFYFLTMELPKVPLFKEQNELSSLPQIALNELLKRYDGKTISEKIEVIDGVENVEKKTFEVT